ncbi:N-acetylmuramoyl-L-alanine amidase precursor [Gallus gallus]|uniref:Peptidoglycan recognition protein 2 n=1 Tax=Gallus gallus TaxID=9031 RepID=A0A8V0XK66_CHICK|nr:N-acetylmuramoyl-L-alanine amidase precursor [Gallus gallus]NP_001385004.1 N-acetylmuramoyl-L-alanine amidase precursor [Gallus gallus]
MCCSAAAVLLLLVVLSARTQAALLPHHISSLIPILQSLEADGTPDIPSLVRSLGGCGTPVCHTLLGDPPPTPTPIPEPWALLAHLLHPNATAAERGALLAPDGSTVALAPLFAGVEVGLKRAAGRSGPIDQPYASLDALYAVTITEALGTSFLVARVNGTAALGPDGCWDDVDNPQNFTLLGPPSLVPHAVANGAMDGVLLGTRLAEDPIPLSVLFRRYYGVDNGIARGWPHSSRRRRDFGALTAVGKLEEEVAAMLRVLRGLPHTHELLEEFGEEEEADIARRAAREFMEVYVECPAIIPRCMWGARPYRGTPRPLSPPLGSIYIHHTFVPSAPCRSFTACARDMRSMQRFHQDTRGWDDIGYSFVVGSDGYLYQGRGWRWVGAHTRGHNTKGYGVGYVGNFSASLPDPEAIALVRDGLIPCAVRAGWLHQNYTLHGHRQMVNTSCPGDALFQEIQTWHGFK